VERKEDDGEEEEEENKERGGILGLDVWGRWKRKYGPVHSKKMGTARVCRSLD
jgi:hypothetical protein